ncbi:nicotinamide-nucleotide adenylyltransferase [Vibrio phage D220]
MKKYAHSLVLGKFMDAHIGHEALFRFTIGLAHKTTTLVCLGDNDRMDVDRRAEWIRDTVGKAAEVLIIDQREEGLEQKEESDVGVSKQWAEWVEKRFPTVDVVAGSEDYITYMADASDRFDAAIFDQERKAFPISSTKVNAGAYHMRMHEAKRDLSEKVYILGAESSGKSVVVKELAKEFQCDSVMEQARKYINDRGDFCRSDLTIYALAQELEVRKAINAAVGKTLLIDSSVFTTIAYGMHYFKQGLADENLLYELAGQEDGLYILMTPEVPWVDDGTRIMPDLNERWDLFHQMFVLLEGMNKHFVIVTGDDYIERTDKVRQHIKTEYQL